MLPELDSHAMEVNSTRNARSKFFNKVNKTALLSAFGLGFAGPAIGIGMAGAIVASAIGVGSVGIETYYKIKENIKYGARVRQFKNLAKIMSEETGISIEFDMDLEKRKAGFKLEGSDRFLTSDDLRDPSIFPEGMDDVILDIFENGGKLNRIGKLSGMFAKRIKGVAPLNKYRGKGASARKFKEERFADFPLITFDNVSAAFNDFGGVKSRKELNDYQFDYNEIVQARKEEQAEESTLGENDDISYTDPNELENSLGDLNSEQILGQQDNGNSMPQGDEQQQNTQEQTPEAPVPTPEQQENGNEQQEVEVVNPLSPSVQDPNVTQIQFPQDAQDQLKSELTDWIRSEVQDPTNGIAVADKLEEAIVGRKDELSEQSKIDLVNLFHDEVKFTEGQMERFDFICRHDRTLTDFEIKEAIAKLEQVRATQGETQLGMAVSAFLNEHSNLTKEDLETLHKFDTSKNLGFEEAINSKFNGQGPTR
ncbi:MAG: hypothetical protein K2I70_00850 [Bacilli bacterium]|nr:hypothetical protein [Bacilli bacterium]